jgi:hypothetical protein
MNKKFIFSFLFFITHFFNIYCQKSNQASLSGKVIDIETKTPIYGVTVYTIIAGETEATTTDDQGDFSFNQLKPGRIDIKTKILGYEDATVNQVLINVGKQLNITISITEKATQMNEVIIEGKDKTRASNTFAAVSAFSFTVEETKRYAATLNDPARMAQSFAGVVSSNDENNQIVVRGNSPRGMLWRLNGLEIPNPNHFAASEGATGGGVSMLSANMLSNTDFYSGAFQAEFGNALSGVFDLNFRKGNAQKHEFAVQVGILGLEAAAEGPFSKKYKGSFLINYRYSTLDILGKMGFTFGQNQTPKYQDLAFNFYLPISKKANFTLYGLGGLSSLGNSPKKDTTTWKSPKDQQTEDLNQRAGVVGGTFSVYFNDKTSWHTNLALSGSKNIFIADSITPTYDFKSLESNSFGYVQLRASTQILRKIDSKNTIKAGFFHTVNWYNLSSSRINIVDLNQQGASHLSQAYWQWKHRLSNKTSFVSGIHFTYFNLTKKFYAEPRFSVEHKIKESHLLSLGVGLHSRTDAISTYISTLGSETNNGLTNRDLELSRAFHSVIGYSFSFLKNFRLKSEVYFQYLFDVPAGYGRYDFYSSINQTDGFINFTLISKGKGINYGLELTLEKFFAQNYFFLVTASVFDSKYKNNDKWHNTAFNARHVLNVLGGKEFVVGKKKINRIILNSKLLWRGGMRQPDIDLDASKIAGETIYSFDKPYSVKLPDYFRLDLGLSFRKNQKRWNWQVGVEIQNVINRKNVAAYRYDKYTQAIEIIRNIGIIPIFYFKAEF